MDMNHLRYFKKVAELQNMTKAAEELVMTQPALSRVIKNLEEEMRVQLFERYGKNIILNKNGEILLKYTNVILDALETAQHEIRELKTREKKKVVLVMRTAIATLPYLMKGFQLACPDVELEVFRNFEDNEQVDSDFIIDIDIVKDPHEDRIILLEEESKLLLSKYNSLLKNENQKLTDFKNETFYVLMGSMQNLITEKACKNAGFMPVMNADYVSSETIHSFVEAGMGVSIVPDKTWNSSTHPNLVKLDIPLKTYKRYIYLKSFTSKTNESAEKFKQYCIVFFQKMQEAENLHKFLNKFTMSDL